MDNKVFSRMVFILSVLLVLLAPSTVYALELEIVDPGARYDTNAHNDVQVTAVVRELTEDTSVDDIDIGGEISVGDTYPARLSGTDTKAEIEGTVAADSLVLEDSRTFDLTVQYEQKQDTATITIYHDSIDPVIHEVTPEMETAVGGEVIDLDYDTVTADEEIKIKVDVENGDTVILVNGRTYDTELLEYNPEEEVFETDSVSLSQEGNELLILAGDRAGNTAQYTVEIYLRTEGPLIKVDEPSSEISYEENLFAGDYTGDTKVTVGGQVSAYDPEVDRSGENGIFDEVTVAGEQVLSNDSGPFETEIELDTDTYNKVLVTGRDVLGNTNSETVVFGQSSSSPELTVDTPASGSVFPDRAAVPEVEGEVTDALKIEAINYGYGWLNVGERQLSFNSNFSLDHLGDTQYRFEVKARNAVGETVSVDRVVYIEEVNPNVEILDYIPAPRYPDKADWKVIEFEPDEDENKEFIKTNKPETDVIAVPIAVGDLQEDTFGLKVRWSNEQGQIVSDTASIGELKEEEEEEIRLLITVPDGDETDDVYFDLYEDTEVIKNDADPISTRRIVTVRDDRAPGVRRVEDDPYWPGIVQEDGRILTNEYHPAVKYMIEEEFYDTHPVLEGLRKDYDIEVLQLDLEEEKVVRDWERAQGETFRFHPQIGERYGFVFMDPLTNRKLDEFEFVTDASPPEFDIYGAGGADIIGRVNRTYGGVFEIHLELKENVENLQLMDCRRDGSCESPRLMEKDNRLEPGTVTFLLDDEDMDIYPELHYFRIALEDKLGNTALETIIIERLTDPEQPDFGRAQMGLSLDVQDAVTVGQEAVEVGVYLENAGANDFYTRFDTPVLTIDQGEGKNVGKVFESQRISDTVHSVRGGTYERKELKVDIPDDLEPGTVIEFGAQVYGYSAGSGELVSDTLSLGGGEAEVYGYPDVKLDLKNTDFNKSLVLGESENGELAFAPAGAPGRLDRTDMDLSVSIVDLKNQQVLGDTYVLTAHEGFEDLADPERGSVEYTLEYLERRELPEGFHYQIAKRASDYNRDELEHLFLFNPMDTGIIQEQVEDISEDEPSELLIRYQGVEASDTLHLRYTDNPGFEVVGSSLADTTGLEGDSLVDIVEIGRKESQVTNSDGAVEVQNLRRGGEMASEQYVDDFFVYPNPYRPERDDELKFSVGESSNGDQPVGQPGEPATITIYSLTGELVREIDIPEGLPSSGRITNISWDGRNERFDSVSSGGYIVVLEAQGDDSDSVQEKTKIAVIRE